MVGRWDIEIMYGYVGDGSLWVDTDAIKYSIRKAGLAPSGCDYQSCRHQLKPNAPPVDGWSTLPAPFHRLDFLVIASGPRSAVAAWPPFSVLGKIDDHCKGSLSEVS